MIQPEFVPPASRARFPRSEFSPAPSVLVVDDNPMIVEMLAMLLESAGFFVTATTDSRDALLRLTATPAEFDALVADHEMPVLCGSELIDRARAAGFSGKVVIHSGSMGGADAEEKARRADAVVHKPLGVRALVPVLRHLISGEGDDGHTIPFPR